MPYDSVYLEKRPPGALRTVWRKFYGDTTAMIGLYGCAALALLCVFGGWFAPYGIDQQFLGYQLPAVMVAVRRSVVLPRDRRSRSRRPEPPAERRGADGRRRICGDASAPRCWAGARRDCRFNPACGRR
jgi:hypothetical protein